jgi:hypothetical protein
MAFIQRAVNRRHARRPKERGAILAFSGIVVLVLVGMIGLGVDMSYVVLTRGELQDASDAAALAAMQSLRRGQTQAQARQAAVDVAAANSAGGNDVRLASNDVIFGNYDFDRRRFLPGRNFDNPAAVRVLARRTEGSPGGPVPTIFASVLGIDQANVAADAIAAIGKRELVIVQDITFSFLEEIDDATDADATLVAAMVRQNLGGERVGVVTFNEAASRRLGLTEVHANENVIIDELQSIQACPNSSTRNCGGTHIATGFDEATSLFQDEGESNAQRVIVLVSDGMPYPSNRRGPAIDAANAAAREGINIFTVTLTQESSGGSYGSGGADAEFNRGLVRGFGRAYHTPNSEDLDDLLLQVLREIPVSLVQ